MKVTVTFEVDHASSKKHAELVVETFLRRKGVIQREEDIYGYESLEVKEEDYEK